MKKLTVIIFTLVVFVLSLTVQHFAKADMVSSDVFKKDVQGLKAEAGIGKVKIFWSLSDTSDVAKVQIYWTNPDSGELEKLQELSRDAKETEFAVPPLATVRVNVKLVSSTGNISEGQSIDVMAKHKNVVFDQCEGRKLAIYLPDGYDTEKKSYPIVYMHDGQNLFSKYVAPGGFEWQVDEAVDRLISQGKIPKLIVVGIYSNDRRDQEYTPYIDRVREGGEAPLYAKFIVNKIMPYVEGKYRVLKGRENHAVMGSSFGGILSLYMGYNYPQLFSTVGAISPSYWHSDSEMIREYAQIGKPKIRVWMDMGEQESMRVYDVHQMVPVLLNKGFKYGDDFLFYDVKGASHNEASWSERVELPFIYFKGKKATKITNFDVNLISCWDSTLLGSALGSAEVYFNKVNAFVEMDNGLKYSLYNQAKYKIIEGKDVTIDADGTLNVKYAQKIKVAVQYKNFYKEVTLDVTPN